MFRHVYFDGSPRAYGELWWACSRPSPRVFIDAAPAMHRRALALAFDLEDCSGTLATRSREGSRPNVALCAAPAHPRLDRDTAEEFFFERLASMGEEDRLELLRNVELDARLASLAEAYGIYADQLRPWE